jgi:hypothetical protein
MCDRHNGTRIGPRRLQAVGTAVRTRDRSLLATGGSRALYIAVLKYALPCVVWLPFDAPTLTVQRLGRIEKSRAVRKHGTSAMASPKASYHWAVQPISFVLELDGEEKKLLSTWMMIVQEQLEKKDKHYWNINARANRLRAKIRDLKPLE